MAWRGAGVMRCEVYAQHAYCAQRALRRYARARYAAMPYCRRYAAVHIFFISSASDAVPLIRLFLPAFFVTQLSPSPRLSSAAAFAV